MLLRPILQLQLGAVIANANTLFVHVKYTPKSNMATWFRTHLSDVTSPHVYMTCMQ